MAFWAMLQRTFDFHKEPTPQPQTTHVPASESLPPPDTKHVSLSLVRPDRQLTYDGVIHFEWPPPEHDHDTITVDRIHADIDGPSPLPRCRSCRLFWSTIRHSCFTSPYPSHTVVRFPSKSVSIHLMLSVASLHAFPLGVPLTQFRAHRDRSRRKCQLGSKLACKLARLLSVRLR